MSRSPSPYTPRDKLNRMNPGSADVRLGHIIDELITNYNALLAAAQNSILSIATLAIKAGGSAVVKSTTPLCASVGGVLVRKAASTDMAALVGTLATAKSAAWAFYIDASGTLTSSVKTADSATHDAALALVASTPVGKAMIGVVVVDNATGANFVGGTTPLDTGSLTVTYYDARGVFIGSVSPTVLPATLLSLR